MKNNSCKNNKLNNKGFSLIEVLVAVVILALVAGPILMAFVMSARFNARARETQRVSAVAESVMEEFKGMSIADAKKPATYGAGCEYNDVTKVYTFKGSKSFDGRDYDVRITATPLRDKEATNLNGSDTSKDPVIKTRGMDAYKDFVYTQDLYQDKTVYDRVLNEVLTYLEGTDHFRDVYPSVIAAELDKDRITIDRYVLLEINGNESVQKAKVTFIYIYKINNYPITGYPSVSCDTFIPITINVPEKEYTGLESAYLFYSPGYKSLPAKKVARINTDTVRIINNLPYRINGYIVKQTNPLYGMDLTTCNAEYTPDVAADGDVDLRVCASESDSIDRFNDRTTDNESLMYSLNVEVFEAGARDAGLPALYNLEGTINSGDSNG